MDTPTKILVLAANPRNTGKLRLDEEIREISEGLQRSKNRNQFELQSRLAVRLRDLRRALLDEMPNIVHFSGHADQEGLVVEDETGKSVFVSQEAIKGLFELFSDQVKCVVLNACYSESQAQGISQHIEYVVVSLGLRDELLGRGFRILMPFSASSATASVTTIGGFFPIVGSANPTLEQGNRLRSARIITSNRVFYAQNSLLQAVLIHMFPSRSKAIT